MRDDEERDNHVIQEEGTTSRGLFVSLLGLSITLFESFNLRATMSFQVVNQ